MIDKTEIGETSRGPSIKDQVQWFVRNITLDQSTKDEISKRSRSIIEKWIAPESKLEPVLALPSQLVDGIKNGVNKGKEINKGRSLVEIAAVFLGETKEEFRLGEFQWFPLLSAMCTDLTTSSPEYAQSLGLFHTHPIELPPSPHDLGNLLMNHRVSQLMATESGTLYLAIKTDLAKKDPSARYPVIFERLRKQIDKLYGQDNSASRDAFLGQLQLDMKNRVIGLLPGLPTLVLTRDVRKLALANAEKALEWDVIFCKRYGIALYQGDLATSQLRLISS